MWSEQVVNVPLPLACRGCLATDVKLYDIHKNNLVESYTQLMGLQVLPTDRYPQKLCSYCAMLLHKFSLFRTKCQRSQQLLIDAEMQGRCITTSYIRKINQTCQEIKPNYIKTAVTTLEFLDMESQKNDTNLIKQENDISEHAQVDCLLYADRKIEPEIEIEKNEIESDKETEELLIVFTEECKNESKVKPKVRRRNNNSKRRKTRNGKEKEKNVDRVTEFAKTTNFDVIFLTRDQQLQEIEERKNDISEIGKTLKCEFCGKTFLNNDTLESHLKAYHDPKVGDYVCDICQSVFKARRRLVTHLRVHSMRFCCKTCGFITKTRDTLRSHHEWHQGKTHVCQYCKKQFGKLSSYFTHIRLKHAAELSWCELCGESFIGDKGINDHKKKAHRDMEEANHSCTNCNKNFMYETALKRHESLGRCDLPNCVQCGDNFASEMLLKYHLIQNHRVVLMSQLTECENCKVRFQNAAALARHATVCGVGQSPCVQCGANFSSDQQLNEHISEQHDDREEFKCEECNRTFTNAFYFREHFSKGRIHNDKKGGICRKPRIERNVNRPKRTKWRPISNAIRKWRLGDEHRNIVMEKQHPNGSMVEKNIYYEAMCEVCGKSFQTTALLKYHQRIHTGENLHHCGHCSKTFVSKTQLTAHLRVHTGERPFSCEQCHKSFKTLAGLSRHGLIHSDIRRHVCELCDKTFRTSTCVKVHIKTVHMKLPAPPRNRRTRVKNN